MSLTLTKGYSNTTAATTDDTIKSAYNLKFADSYVLIEEPSKAQAKAKQISVGRKLFKNITSATKDAMEFLHINLDAPSGIRFRGAIADFAGKILPSPGAIPAGFTTQLGGWFKISDPNDSAMKPYNRKYNVTISVQWERDDLIDADVLRELIGRAVSVYTKNDGALDRIVEMSNGAYSVTN